MLDTVHDTAPPPRAVPDDVRPMVIDAVMEHFDVTIGVHQIVGADPFRTWQAVRDLDLLQVRTPLLVAAFWVRGLPDRLRGTERAAPSALVLGDEHGPGMPGWLALGEDPGRELVLGAVGRFWTPSIDWREVARDEFTGFAEPGWGKIAVSFSLRPYGVARTLLSYECRTATTDGDSRRRFGRYWKLVRPFVAHVMRATVVHASACAERPDDS